MTSLAAPSIRLPLLALALTPAAFALATAPVGTLLPLVALVWLFVADSRFPLRAQLGDPWLLLMLATSLLGIASALWALDGRLAATKALLFLATTLPLSLLVTGFPAAADERVPRWLLAGFAGGLALVAVQTHGDLLLRGLLFGTTRLHPEHQLNVPAAGLAIACWLVPLACMRLERRGWWLALVLVLATGGTAAVSDGSAPALGWLVGCLTLLLGRALPRLVVGGLAAGLLLAQFAAPHFGESEFMQSHIADRNSRIRMDIWQLADQLSQDRPWLGYGFSNSREIPERPHTMPLTGKHAKLPLYPHNVLLEARLELGLPGMLLLHGCWWLLLWRALQLPPWARATALALLASGMAVWCVGYPLWRSAWLAWLFYVALGFVGLLRSGGGNAASQTASRPPTTGIE